ncbi:MAG: hypothetical protein IJX18_02280 [Clostridia bacterium]|nr:hypothetical protein [Clostridia bacterium]
MKNKFLAILLSTAFIGSVCAFSSCNDGGQVRVYAPDGAPALALSKLLSEDRAEDGIEYTITSSDNIKPFVTGKTADVCILPVNLASILLGDGSTYQMVGLATHGNLYLLSAENKQYTRDNLDELKGKKIGVVNLANVPGLTLRATLSDLQVAYSLSEQTADSVYLYGATPAEAKPTGNADLYLLPEPKVSEKLNEFENELFLAGDLQTLYGGESGYPQAAVVAKKEFVQNNPAAFTKIIEGLSQGESYLSSASINEICDAVAVHREEGLSANFTKETLTREGIARSNVRFEKSSLCHEKVDAFLQKLAQIDGTKAQSVGENFYYFED